MDWVALTLSVVGIVLNARKIIWCWPVWMASTVFWGIFALQTGQRPLLVLQVVFFVMNAYG